MDNVKENPELNALLELRQLVAAELDEDEVAYRGTRTMRPLTDGLGLESPRKDAVAPTPTPLIPLPFESEKPNEEEESEAAPSGSMQALFDGAAKEARQEKEVVKEAKAPAPKKPQAPFAEHLPEVPSVVAKGEAAKAFFQEAPVATPPVAPPAPAVTAAPPPLLKSASVVRRFLAALIDEVFVLSLFVLALALTMKLMLGSQLDLYSTEGLRNLQHPALLRFAILEFATIWIAYFAFGIGLLDMTFGMWVWGIRVGYGETGTGGFFQKLMRIFVGFLFYAPIFPLALLVVQRKGRNLLDWLTGTRVYRVVV